MNTLNQQLAGLHTDVCVNYKEHGCDLVRPSAKPESFHSKSPPIGWRIRGCLVASAQPSVCVCVCRILCFYTPEVQLLDTVATLSPIAALAVAFVKKGTQTACVRHLHLSQNLRLSNLLRLHHRPFAAQVFPFAVDTSETSRKYRF